VLVARPDTVCVYVHDYKAVDSPHASSLRHRPGIFRNTLRGDSAVNRSRTQFFILYNLLVYSRLLLLESVSDARQVSKCGCIA
jgi:hypothetical protein